MCERKLERKRLPEASWCILNELFLVDMSVGCIVIVCLFHDASSNDISDCCRSPICAAGIAKRGSERPSASIVRRNIRSERREPRRIPYHPHAHCWAHPVIPMLQEWPRFFWQQPGMVTTMGFPVRAGEGRRTKLTVWTRAILALASRMCDWDFPCMLLPFQTFVMPPLCINNLRRLLAPFSLKRQVLILVLPFLMVLF